MKTLVTHLFPHRDDVAGLWLLKRFDPKLRDANLMFIPTGAGVRLDAKHIGVGVGRGKYDEHKGDLKDSATSLIWKDLKRRKLLPTGVEGAALAELADMVRQGDMGKGIGTPNHWRNDTKILQTIAGLPGQDSILATQWGFTLMDALYHLYTERTHAIRAIKKGKPFMTKWGRGVAIASDILPGMASTISAELGYEMVVLEHPTRAYLHVRSSPHCKADFSKLYKMVGGIEPDGHWYLHHSKRMLLHGDLVAPTPIKSRFRLADMVKLIRHLYA